MKLYQIRFGCLFYGLVDNYSRRNARFIFVVNIKYWNRSKKICLDNITLRHYRFWIMKKLTTSEMDTVQARFETNELDMRVLRCCWWKCWHSRVCLLAIISRHCSSLGQHPGSAIFDNTRITCKAPCFSILLFSEQFSDLFDFLSKKLSGETLALFLPETTFHETM